MPTMTRWIFEMPAHTYDEKTKQEQQDMSARFTSSYTTVYTRNMTKQDRIVLNNTLTFYGKKFRYQIILVRLSVLLMGRATFVVILRIETRTMRLAIIYFTWNDVKVPWRHCVVCTRSVCNIPMGILLWILLLEFQIFHPNKVVAAISKNKFA